MFQVASFRQLPSLPGPSTLSTLSLVAQMSPWPDLLEALDCVPWMAGMTNFPTPRMKSGLLTFLYLCLYG